MGRLKSVLLILISVISLDLGGKSSSLLLGVTAFEFNRHRHDFPSGFLFGSTTSAYQVEGAAFEDGRTPSVFDTLSFLGRYPSGEGRTGANEYHKYKEDVQLMVETGLDAYRFSISWSRLIPDGRGDVNLMGLTYYNNLINELVSHGIQPHATLLHFDLPQALQDEYGGIMSRRIIEDFRAYADVCFREFGDRVRHWSTINEANLMAISDSIFTSSTPGPHRSRRLLSHFGSSCTVWNSSIDPYIAAHNILLVHASVSQLYKQKYQAKQHGFVGFILFAPCFIPFSDTKVDAEAARRTKEFYFGWFMNPLLHGDYPEIMKKNVGTRLPVFAKNESQLVKGSFDFVGLNYYFVIKTKDNPLAHLIQPPNFDADMATQLILPPGSEHVMPYPNTPWGLQGLLEEFKDLYDNPNVFIYENGQITNSNASVNDSSRVEYLQSHIGGLLDVVRNGSNTKGYFVWSFVDVFEFLWGYQARMGLYYVDFNDPHFTRYPKISQKWYSKFLKGNITNGSLDFQDVDDLRFYI